MKDAGGKLMAMVQSLSGVGHMEIASYTILIAAARSLSETEVSRSANTTVGRKWRWRNGWQIT